MTHPSAEPLCSITIHWRDGTRMPTIRPDIPEMDGDGRPYAESLLADIIESHSKEARRIALNRQHRARVAVDLLADWTKSGGFRRHTTVRSIVREAIEAGDVRLVRETDSRGTAA